MSIEALVGALNHSKAQGAAHLVLLTIANHQGEQGAWPSIPTISRLAKVSDRRVQQILNELVELGELIIEPRAAGYGSIRTNRYWVTVNCPDTCDGTFAHRVVQPVSDRGEVGFTDGVKPVSLGGEVDFTQTNIKTNNETILNPSMPRRQKPAKAITENWQPSEKLSAEFRSKWSTLVMADQVEAFVNHHLAKGSRFVDWDAAFRNWCNNSVKWAKAATASIYDGVEGYK